MQNMTKVIDLTPAERARLKLYTHFALIAVFNGVLSACALLSDGKLIDWHTILVAAVGQSTLALLDALRKYFAASGQPLLSTVVAGAAQELAATLPASPPLNANLQTIQTDVNQYLNSQPVTTTPTPANAVPVSEVPDFSQVQTMNTLPNISAVRAG